MIELRNVWRTYQVGDSEVHALRDVDLGLDEGDYMAVVGPSGSGKSTLLNILGCLDRPTGGEYVFRGARAYPSYLQAGPSFFIEKSKRRMIAEDIKAALSLEIGRAHV